MSSAVVKREDEFVKVWLPEISLVAILAALSVLLTYQIAHLWSRPHFQFAPMAWCAFAVFLFVQHGPIGTVENIWRGRLGKLFCFVGLVLAAMAAQVFSPWLAHVAAACCIAGWGLLRLPELNMWKWLGWTLLIWCTVPLPGTLDGTVVNTLQRLSSQSASHLLDLCGVLHLRQGNLIEIRNHKLFVDEACSGIDSLYALLAVAIFVALWRQLPLVVGALSLVCVPIFAWFGNVVRLFAITWLLDAYNFDLSHGTAHTILGVVTFGLSAASLFVTSLAFSHLFRRLPSAAVARSQTLWHRIYNVVVCFPGKPPTAKEESNEYFEHPRSDSADKPRAPSVRKTFRISRYEFAGMFVIATVCLGLSIYKVTRSNSGEHISLALPHFEQAEVDAAFSKEKLPAALGQANMAHYTKHHRPADTFFGEHSRTWTYHHPICDFQVSVDFPFLGFHPLWICYTTTGNTLMEDPSIIAIPGNDTAQITEMKIIDELGSPAYVWFAFVNQSGEPLEPSPFKQDLKTTFTGRLLNAFRASVLQPQVVSYQYQLYLPAGRELTVAERKEVLEMFAECLPSVSNQVKLLKK